MNKRYKSQVQHFVPQFVLDEFATHGQIWVYDKHQEKSFLTNTKNIMSERDFNAVSLGAAVLNFEQRLSRLEEIAAPTLKKLIRTQSMSSLDVHEFAQLCMFVTAQLLRTKQHRRSFELMREEMTKRVPNLKEEELLRQLGAVELDKLSSLTFLSDSLGEFTKYLILKHVVILKRECADGYYISDNPVVLHNDNKFGPYGNLGLAVPGIQIFYPFSPDCALGFLCPTIIAEYERKLATAKKNVDQLSAQKFLSPAGITANDAISIQATRAQIKTAESHLDQLKNKRRIAVAAENLLFMNSLQLMQSYRFVASKRRDFELADKAMRERPSWRKPSLFKVA